MNIESKIPAGNSPEVLEIVTDCIKDTRNFCRVFLQDNFYSDFVPDVHDPIFGLLDEVKDRKKSVVCATRGIGKTTIARAKAARAICLAEKRFIVYLGKSSTHAEMQTENLKKDLMGADIRRVFGRIKAQVPGDIDESWSKKAWVAMVGSLCECGHTLNGLCEFCNTVGEAHYTFVLPRGAGQQIRGLVWKAPDGRNIRPDLIIADDEEDPENIKSEEWRYKNKEWFFADVMHCFPRIEKDWEIFYIDTLKHEDSLMQMLLESSDWDSLILPACDDNYQTLAPDFISQEELDEMVEIARRDGTLDVFAREIMCNPISREDATFRQEYFEHYKEDDKEFRERLPRLINVVLIDPAKTAKKHSAESGFVVWGVDIELGTLYLRYAAGERLHPDQIWDRGIELALQYEARVIGIEDTGLGEFATYPLVNEIMRRGLAIEVEGLKARRGGKIKEAKGFEAGKVQRVASLEGYYRKGLIKHNKIGTGAYELQLLGYPRSKRWDIMDCAAYITEMLDKGALYFYSHGVNDSDPVAVEKEYEDMERELREEEMSMSDAWRVCP